MLDDGVYEAIVIDAVDVGDGATELELTLLEGTHKGQVVSFMAHGLSREALDLLGLPATITVDAGDPRVDIDA